MQAEGGNGDANALRRRRDLPKPLRRRSTDRPGGAGFPPLPGPEDRGLNGRVDELEERLAAVGEQINGLDRRMEHMITALSSQVATRADDLGDRLARVEQASDARGEARLGYSDARMHTGFEQTQSRVEAGFERMGQDVEGVAESVADALALVAEPLERLTAAMADTQGLAAVVAEQSDAINRQFESLRRRLPSRPRSAAVLDDESLARLADLVAERLRPRRQRL